MHHSQAEAFQGLQYGNEDATIDGERTITLIVGQAAAVQYTEGVASQLPHALQALPCTYLVNLNC
ncbi:MAG: hypothetical protein F6J95_027945 [Leptolyngbya sp. SIO1E4]|nr:hypothetical protein [Leptolyngbya sp. SIO1E4]